MMEMRWLEYQEEEAFVPPTSEIQYGKPFDRLMVTKQKLQYRQKVDITIRAAAAGMWDNESTARTANYQWSAWQDVPVYKE
jgi:hypothetical protein